MEQSLAHHGIKGQKWGVRRFQNEDGSYTSAGKKRYRDGWLTDGEPKRRDPFKNVPGARNDPGIAGSAQKKSNTGKKVAIGVAIGVTAATGAAVATYFLRKQGAKKLSAITSNPVVVDAGKKAVEAAKSAVGSTAANAVKSAASSAASAGHKITNNYDFGALQRQNNDLLEQLYRNMGA